MIALRSCTRHLLPITVRKLDQRTKIDLTLLHHHFAEHVHIFKLLEDAHRFKKRKKFQKVKCLTKNDGTSATGY